MQRNEAFALWELLASIFVFCSLILPLAGFCAKSLLSANNLQQKWQCALIADELMKQAILERRSLDSWLLFWPDGEPGQFLKLGQLINLKSRIASSYDCKTLLSRSWQLRITQGRRGQRLVIQTVKAGRGWSWTKEIEDLHY